MARGGIEPPTRGFSERRGPIRLQLSRVFNTIQEMTYRISTDPSKAAEIIPVRWSLGAN